MRGTPCESPSAPHRSARNPARVTFALPKSTGCRSACPCASPGGRTRALLWAAVAASAIGGSALPKPARRVTGIVCLKSTGLPLTRTRPGTCSKGVQHEGPILALQLRNGRADSYTDDNPRAQAYPARMAQACQGHRGNPTRARGHVAQASAQRLTLKHPHIRRQKKCRARPTPEFSLGQKKPEPGTTRKNRPLGKTPGPGETAPGWGVPLGQF